MSDTPRTDKVDNKASPDTNGNLDWKYAYFHLLTHAKTLERELNVKWNGVDRRCDHEMKWVSDWGGDSSIPNGTFDCSRSECELCDWVDPNGERPEPDPDELRDGWEAA